MNDSTCIHKQTLKLYSVIKDFISIKKITNANLFTVQKYQRVLEKQFLTIFNDNRGSKRCYYHPLKTTLNFTKFLKTQILVKSVFCQTSGQFTIVVVSKDWCQDFGAPLENICCLMAVEESQKMKLWNSGKRNNFVKLKIFLHFKKKRPAQIRMF